MLSTKTFLIISGGFVSTYIINAIVAPLYSNNCVQLLNYNFPFCLTALSILTGASYLNYWVFYTTITTLGIILISKTIQK